MVSCSFLDVATSVVVAGSSFGVVRIFFTIKIRIARFEIRFFLIVNTNFLTYKTEAVIGKNDTFYCSSCS